MSGLARLGFFVLVLGIIGLIRLLPEVLQIAKLSRNHAAFATVDAVLALVTGAAGEGLRHGKRWAPKLAMRAAGVVLSTSIGMIAFFVHWLIQHQNQIYEIDPLIVSRMLYYVLAVGFWPYGVRTLIVAGPEESRASLKACFVIWLVLGIPAAAVMLLAFR